MNLPYFYTATFTATATTVTLDEDNSRHIVQVLRMKKGEPLQLTDGQGHRILATVEDDHKKHCTVAVRSIEQIPALQPKAVIGISLLKNSNRFEWFLEKATELGITEIIPLLCQRTEREKFRMDRLHGILVSAMLQSQQCWLPRLHEPVAFDHLLNSENVFPAGKRFIAHCNDGDKKPLSQLVAEISDNRTLLIGPEGDFTMEEVELALRSGFDPVSLGETRLRTETAGVVGATILKMNSPAKGKLQP